MHTIVSKVDYVQALSPVDNPCDAAAIADCSRQDFEAATSPRTAFDKFSQRAVLLPPQRPTARCSRPPALGFLTPCGTNALIHVINLN